MNSPLGNMCLVGLDKELGLGHAEWDGVLLLFEKHMVYMSECGGGGVGRTALPSCGSIHCDPNGSDSATTMSPK